MYGKLIQCILIFILLSVTGEMALKGQSLIIGQVLDAKTDEPLSGASVFARGSDAGVYTDENGRFRLKTTAERVELRIRYLGYEELSVPMDLRPRSANARAQGPFTFRLVPADVALPSTTITSSRLARLYPDKKVQVQDFEFMGDNLLLIVYDRNLKRNVVQLWNNEMELMAEYNHSAEPPIRLETDCLGNLQCLSENYAWQVNFALRQLVLRGDSIHTYQQQVEPCLALLDSTYFFGLTPHPYLKSFIYVHADERRRHHLYASMDTTAMVRIADEGSMSQKIVSPELMHSRARGPQAKAFQEGLNARYLTTIEFPEVYIPMHVLGGTAVIFDHTQKKLLRFDAQGEKLAEVPITYPELRRWQRNVIVDQEHRRAFTITLKNGISTLHRIDLESGELDRSWQLPLPFVQKIKVRGDYIYFLYRDNDYDPVKRLYRFEM